MTTVEKSPHSHKKCVRLLLLNGMLPSQSHGTTTFSPYQSILFGVQLGSQCKLNRSVNLKFKLIKLNVPNRTEYYNKGHISCLKSAFTQSSHDSEMAER